MNLTSPRVRWPRLGALTRRSIGLGLLAATAFAVVPAPVVNAATEAPTDAAVTDFALVNGASFERDSVPRGAVLSLFTDGPVSGEAQAFPGVDTTPAGVYVAVDNCTLGGPPRRLPILYVGPTSWGGSQINLYFPNDVGPEPYGECTSPPISAVFSTFTLHTADGHTVTRQLTTNPISPGMFVYSAPQPAHYNTTTGVYTALTQCAQDPTRCPVSTNGRANFLILWTTGGELRYCNIAGFRACDDPQAVEFSLTPASGSDTAVDQSLTYYGPDGGGGQGVDQANVQLASDTAPGEYRLAMRMPGLPDQSPLQQVAVTLGPADQARS